MTSVKRSPSPPPDGRSSKKLKTKDSESSPPPNFEDDLALLEVSST